MENKGKGKGVGRVGGAVRDKPSQLPFSFSPNQRHVKKIPSTFFFEKVLGDLQGVFVEKGPCFSR